MNNDFDFKSTEKKPVNKTILCIAISFISLFIAGIVLFCVFLPNIKETLYNEAKEYDIVGTWVHTFEEGDQVFEVYYTIDKTKGDYTLDVGYYTTHYPGSCDVTKNDSGMLVTITPKAGRIYPDAPYGEYTYKVSGNKMLNDATLELTNSSGDVITLAQGEEPKLSDYIEQYDDFEENEKLTGEWMIDFSKYGMEPVVLTFNKDGTMSIDNRGMQTDYYYYSPQEKTIKVASYNGEKVEDEVEYQFQDGNLIFLGNLWTRASEASAN